MVVTTEFFSAKANTMEDIFYEYESANMSHVINCSSQVLCTKTYRKRTRFKVNFKVQMPKNGKLAVRSSKLTKSF